MVVDFHTHTFPEALAEYAIDKLAKSAGVKNYLNGTMDALCASMETAGIDYSILLPVVTRPGQQETIHRTSLEINEKYKAKGQMLHAYRLEMPYMEEELWSPLSKGIFIAKEPGSFYRWMEE